MSDETGVAINQRDEELSKALGERYLSYALSTIMARSLPDVRDGLKPVHRRLLFAMRELGLDPKSGYKKAARVVGDVIGKFHPHGDQAVYETMVRLAQEFALRYPMVDGQGNFGNIDGDNAAAMRYTEARLTQVAQAMLDGIDDDAVDLRLTYDGEHEEPAVLPAAFPNLLANGATGIAVGMATSIPPHNVGEICAALRHMIAHPDCDTAALLVHLRGPDFPTGGCLVEPLETIAAAYETGRGSFRLRARWEKEALKNGSWQIVVSEIPYQLPKARLIERVAQLLADRKLALLADIRDESSDRVRIVLEPKSRTVDPAMLMESLFRQSDFETRFSLNMNVLDAQTIPRVMSLREVLRAFLDHRQVVLERRSRFRLEQIARRLEILQGYIVAFLNLDEIIRIIREEDEPKARLIRLFGLSDHQAEAILNMRLRSLRKLEEIELRREFDALSHEQGDLSAMLADPVKRWARIDSEIAEIDDKFGGKTAIGARRTELAVAMPAIEMPVEAMVEREAITVICSEKGWIRAIKGHDVVVEDVKYKEGDGPRFILKAETVNRLLLFASDGRFYTLGCDRLPRGRGFGEPIRLTIDLGSDQDIVTMRTHRPGGRLLVAANDGRGFLIAEEEALAQTRGGKQILIPGDGARALACLAVTEDHLAVIGDNRKLLIFETQEIPEMTRGRGVILQRYKDGGLADLRFLKLADGISFPFGSRQRVVTDLRPWVGKRAGLGRLVPAGFPRNNKFI